jgi:hypothetical protein
MGMPPILYQPLFTTWTYHIYTFQKKNSMLHETMWNLLQIRQYAYQH